MLQVVYTRALFSEYCPIVDYSRTGFCISVSHAFSIRTQHTSLVPTPQTSKDTRTCLRVRYARITGYGPEPPVRDAEICGYMLWYPLTPVTAVCAPHHRAGVTAYLSEIPHPFSQKASGRQQEATRYLIIQETQRPKQPSRE